MPDSLPPSIVQTQTLPNEFAPVEIWIDGLSNGEATILGFILVTVVGFVGWLFTLKKDAVSATINIHPQIIVENPKSQLPITRAASETPEHKIHSDRLSTVKGEFFGREAELKLLSSEAWAGNGTRIIQFIAPGGTGKTKLLRHWLDHANDIDAPIAWSFYSQGSSEDKQVSATPFFSHEFEKLGSTRSLSSFANLYHDTRNHSRDFTRAHQDLQEVYDIAEPSGMRLHLTDYHLEMARLLIAEKGNPPRSPFVKGGSQGSDVVAIPP